MSAFFMISFDHRWLTSIANEIKPSEKPAQGIGSVLATHIG
jgi:hypothetical protein